MSKTKLDHPHVRKWIKKYLETHASLTLNDVARGCWFDGDGRRHHLLMTSGWKRVAKKMLGEAPSEGEIVWLGEYQIDTAEVQEEADCISFRTCTYQIPFDDCETVERIVFWADHLQENENVTPAMIRRFLVIAGGRIGWKPEVYVGEGIDSEERISSNDD